MDATAIKAALNERAEDFARMLFPAGRKDGREWLIGSLQGEPGRSLSICLYGDKTGVFRDFATEQSGDNLLELFMQAKQVPFIEAKHACQKWLGISAPAATPRRAIRAPVECRTASDVYDLSDEECRAALQMVETLRDDPGLCERIARARGWKTETIHQLASEAYLGWHDGKLAFIYDTGAKLRSRAENGERVIRWAFGKPWLWRGAWIPQAETVYLCEGETDAITLIDSGIESESGTVVVALPSASTFNETWSGLFRGKDVVLTFDNDKAGIEATARVSRLLGPVVRGLKQLNWKGIQYAAAS